MYSNNPYRTSFLVNDILSRTDQQGLEYTSSLGGYMQPPAYPYDASPRSYEQLGLAGNPACIYGNTAPTYHNLSYSVSAPSSNLMSGASTMAGMGGVHGMKSSDYDVNVMHAMPMAVKPEYEALLASSNMDLPVKQEYESHVTELTSPVSGMGDQQCIDEENPEKGEFTGLLLLLLLFSILTISLFVRENSATGLAHLFGVL